MPRNINRVSLFLFGVAAILGTMSFLGVGMLWNRINQPSAIQILCSEEVLKGLKDLNPPPIPKVKVRLKKL